MTQPHAPKPAVPKPRPPHLAMAQFGLPNSTENVALPDYTDALTDLAQAPLETHLQLLTDIYDSLSTTLHEAEN